MHLIVNLFIVYYLVLMVVYDHYIAKSQNRFKLFLYGKVYHLAGYLGLWHSWAMFSSPFTYNYNIYAKIVYDDETTEILDIFDGSKRKFMNSIKTDVFKEKMMENILLEEHEGGIRNGLCNYLYGRYNKKPIKEVVLLKEITYIENFDSESPGGYVGTQEYYTMKGK